MQLKFEPLLKQYLPDLTDEQQEKLARYLALMSKWNKVYNLTSITDPKEMVIKHIADSLAVLPYLDGQRILDVGSGAGLPGIPLAICCPEKQFTLLDSNGRKIEFLRQTLLETGLENAELCKERAENWSTKEYFDMVISRAFSSISQFLACSKHLCCRNGQFLAMKGEYPTNELNQIDKTFTIAWIKSLEVLGLTAKRHLVSIKFSGDCLKIGTVPKFSREGDLNEKGLSQKDNASGQNHCSGQSKRWCGQNHNSS